MPKLIALIISTSSSFGRSICITLKITKLIRPATIEAKAALAGGAFSRTDIIIGTNKVLTDSS